uniref:Uncharacterized protein n=1 Tax=Muribaculaceae bacterium Z82 TaxID=2304548 RepID=A0A7C9ND10_9BACT
MRGKARSGCRALAGPRKLPRLASAPRATSARLRCRSAWAFRDQMADSASRPTQTVSDTQRRSWKGSA